MRSVTRRAKQMRFRRQRVPVEVPEEESASVDPGDDADGPEKIEVHVHVHRGEGSQGARSRRRAVPVLTGALFDWQWYKERLAKQPHQMGDGRWSRPAKCGSCSTMIPSSARRCPRCAAPRPRRLVPVLVALMGLGAIAAVFALSTHVLGLSVPEQQPPTPLGEWSEEDYVIVEVPTAPSPFGYETAAPRNAPPAPQNRAAP